MTFDHIGVTEYLKKKGGVFVFLQDNLSAECIGTYDNRVCELLALHIHSLKTVLIVMYRPPDTRLSAFSTILGEIDKVLSNLPTPMPTIVMMGDLNFPSRVMSLPRVDGVLVRPSGETSSTKYVPETPHVPIC